MKIHPIFHVSLLDPYYKNTILGRILPPLLPIEVNNDWEYEVEEVLDSRIKRNHSEYLVH